MAKRTEPMRQFERFPQPFGVASSERAAGIFGSRSETMDRSIWNSSSKVEGCASVYTEIAYTHAASTLVNHGIAGFRPSRFQWRVGPSILRRPARAGGWP